MVSQKFKSDQQARTCFICGAVSLPLNESDYFACQSCGHQTLKDGFNSSFMVNDDLTVKGMGKETGLDKFKNKTLDEVISEQKGAFKEIRLLDIGAGSGRFLYQNQRKVSSAVGLEVSPASIAFARDKLGVDIIDSIDYIPHRLCVATAWHSFEHIPDIELQRLLKKLSVDMPDWGKIIISVPNASSRQHELFGRFYPFYDVPNHLHQFTLLSLETLMEQYGFKLEKQYESRPYNVFGMVQGLVNIWTRSHNYLYYRLKRNMGERKYLRDMTHAILLLVAGPIGLVIGMAERRDKEKQGVLTLCFTKIP